MNNVFGPLLAGLRAGTRPFRRKPPTSYETDATILTAPPPPLAGLVSVSALEPVGDPVVIQGYLDERSTSHAHGWVIDVADASRRLLCMAVLPASGEIVGRARADQFRHGLADSDGGDGTHAFWMRFTRVLSEPERDTLEVRVEGAAEPLLWSDWGATTYQPLLHIAMDIVDNCNLRCPFCLYDYANTRATHTMASETMDAALRFLPYARDGEFWFSCLHEPTLHPQLVEFVERVPPPYRRKLFFTTNLAKRMPMDYFRWLAGNGMHHINVSIESRDPAIYERMRKGARHPIFLENWNRLVAALEQAETPTKIRYITMAYKSNLRELPDLVAYLLEERHAWQVELRYTYDVPFLAPEFRAAEFLDTGDWQWLADQLAGFDPNRVLLIRPPAPQTEEVRSDAPPEETQPAAPVPDADRTSVVAAPMDDGAVLPGRYMFRMAWDGSVRVVGVRTASHGHEAIETVIEETNVNLIGDPDAYLEQLVARHLHVARPD